MNGQTTLTDTAGPGQRDQSLFEQQRTAFGDLVFAADKSAQLGRQARRWRHTRGLGFARVESLAVGMRLEVAERHIQPLWTRHTQIAALPPRDGIAGYTKRFAERGLGQT
jgi:hypothetical protein